MVNLLVGDPTVERVPASKKKEKEKDDDKTRTNEWMNEWTNGEEEEEEEEEKMAAKKKYLASFSFVRGESLWHAVHSTDSESVKKKKQKYQKKCEERENSVKCGVAHHPTPPTATPTQKKIFEKKIEPVLWLDVPLVFYWEIWWGSVKCFF